MRYLLINSKTGEKTLCEKIVLKGFDYYVSDGEIKEGDWYYWSVTNTIQKSVKDSSGRLPNGTDGSKKVIATNNPNLDIPKVIDVVEELCKKEGHDTILGVGHIWIEGYNKSQETNPYSKEDMLEFYEWCETSDEAAKFWRRNRVYPDMSGSHNVVVRQRRQELLQIWKGQQPEKVYYK